MDLRLPLRLIVHRPPAGTEFRLQRGRVGTGAGPTHVAPTRATADRVTFDVTIDVAPELERDGGVLFLGALVHGTPRERFLYLASGRPAADGAAWQWDRRAKVPLGAITPTLVEATLGAPGAVLEAHVAGTASDGRAAASRVALLDGGWAVVHDDSAP